MKLGAPVPNRNLLSDSHSANLWINETNGRECLNEGGMKYESTKEPCKIGNYKKNHEFFILALNFLKGQTHKIFCIRFFH